MTNTGSPPLFPFDPLWPPELHVEIDKRSKEIEFVAERYAAGEIELAEAVPFPFIGEASQVMESSLDENYWQMGLGKALYLIAMQEFGPIHPDWTGEVSPAAYRVWNSLKKHPAVDLIAAEEVGVDIKFVRATGRNRQLFRIEWPAPVPHANWKTVTYSEWPENWRGVLDQIYWLEEPLNWEG